MGSARLLRQSLALLLGSAVAPGVHAGGLPIAFALTRGECRRTRDPARHLRRRAQTRLGRPGQTLTGDKNYSGQEFEAQLADMHIELLRPAPKGEADRAGSQLFKPLFQ